MVSKPSIESMIADLLINQTESAGDEGPIATTQKKKRKNHRGGQKKKKKSQNNESKAQENMDGGKSTLIPKLVGYQSV